VGIGRAKGDVEQDEEGMETMQTFYLDIVSLADSTLSSTRQRLIF